MISANAANNLANSSKESMDEVMKELEDRITDYAVGGKYGIRIFHTINGVQCWCGMKSHNSAERVIRLSEYIIPKLKDLGYDVKLEPQVNMTSKVLSISWGHQ